MWHFLEAQMAQNTSFHWLHCLNPTNFMSLINLDTPQQMICCLVSPFVTATSGMGETGQFKAQQWWVCSKMWFSSQRHKNVQAWARHKIFAQAKDQSWLWIVHDADLWITHARDCSIIWWQSLQQHSRPSFDQFTCNRRLLVRKPFCLFILTLWICTRRAKNAKVSKRHIWKSARPMPS